jgi:protocatechuate 3,4-dioxygenase beta subunit
VPGLTRLPWCSLILATTILSPFSSSALGQLPDAKPKPAGSISGHVTVGDKPAPGVMIAAFADYANRRPPAQALTDNDGRYVLSGLAPAQYNVTAMVPAFVVAGNSLLGPDKPIALSMNETVESVDFKLVHGSVITGRVTDADNRPVMEERVDLLLVDENGNAANRQPQRSLYNYQMNTTDDRGEYRLYGVPAGRYKVSVGTNPNSGFVTTGPRGYFKQAFYPDVNDVAKATVVELGEGGEVANIDIVVGRRTSTYSVSGRVVDADTHEPLGGTQVSYGSIPKDATYFGGYIILPANSKGEYRLEGLEPGRYGVQIAGQYDSGGYYSDPTLFEVVDSDVSNVEVKATHGLSLSGVVVTDGITSKDALAVLPALRISAYVPGTSSALRTTSSGTSAIGADGSFQINGLRPGKATISFSFGYGSNPAMRAFSITRIERDGAELPQGFDIAAGQPVSGLRVFATFGTGTIRGTVTITGGTLPGDARLYIRASRPGPASAGNSAQVDSRGRFIISNLAAGTYELTLQRYPVPQLHRGEHGKQSALKPLEHFRRRRAQRKGRVHAARSPFRFLSHRIVSSRQRLVRSVRNDRFTAAERNRDKADGCKHSA